MVQCVAAARVPEVVQIRQHEYRACMKSMLFLLCTICCFFPVHLLLCPVFHPCSEDELMEAQQLS